MVYLNTAGNRALQQACVAGRWLKGSRRRLRVGEKGRKWMKRGMAKFQGGIGQHLRKELKSLMEGI